MNGDGQCMGVYGTITTQI